MPAVKVVVDVSDYERSHGKRPRGEGSWAFCTVDPRYAADYLRFVRWYHGSYRAARAQAVAWAQSAKFGAFGEPVEVLYVCS